MRVSKEARLKKLQEKKQSIDAQIKRIESDHHRELRKLQDKRERLIGKAVYALVESGEWEQWRLLDMMHKFLKRPADRALFDLVSLPGDFETQPLNQEEKTTASPSTASSVKGKRKPPRRTPATERGVSEQQQPEPKTALRLPVPEGKESLLDEFNL
jgi:hypothetical protein